MELGNLGSFTLSNSSLLNVLSMFSKLALFVFSLGDKSHLSLVGLLSGMSGFSLHLVLDSDSVHSSLLGFPGSLLDNSSGRSLGFVESVLGGFLLFSSSEDSSSLHALSFVHNVAEFVSGLSVGVVDTLSGGLNTILSTSDDVSLQVVGKSVGFSHGAISSVGDVVGSSELGLKCLHGSSSFGRSFPGAHIDLAIVLVEVSHAGSIGGVSLMDDSSSRSPHGFLNPLVSLDVMSSMCVLMNDDVGSLHSVPVGNLSSSPSHVVLVEGS